MCEQTIVDFRGERITGRLVEHFGNGVVGIDVDGRRHIGRKVTEQEREVAPCTS